MNIVRESFPGAFQMNVNLTDADILTSTTVYACISLISSDIAKMRLRLVKLNQYGIWEEIESPSFSPILRKPNRHQTRIEFIKRWLISKLTNGNTYVLKVRDNRDVVKEMYVLDPRQVTPLQASETGDVYYQINRDDFSNTQETLVIPAREIIHDKMNPLYHPLVGIPPIYAAGLAATQGLKMQNFSSTFFGNGGRPSGTIEAPDEIAPETAARLAEYFSTNFSGANAGKVAVLGDGLKYNPIPISSADAQMIEQLRWSAEAICSCFHVPPSMVGVGPSETNNNVETRWQQYYAQCLQIHIESIELLLDEGLGLSPATNASEPLGTEFDLDDLLRMDTAAMVTAETNAVKGSVKTPNEARRRMGLPPKKGGDTIYLQQQYYSMEALAERDSNDPFSKPEPAPAAEAPEEPAQEAEDQASEGQEAEADDTQKYIDSFRFILEREGIHVNA
jgi:HK97 family phage portal protein